MKIRSLFGACVVLAFLCGAAMGQGRGGGNQQKAPSGPAPKTTSGKPDFSGLWQRPYVPDMSATSRNGDQIGPKELPFTPWVRRSSRSTMPPTVTTPVRAFRLVWCVR